MSAPSNPAPAERSGPPGWLLQIGVGITVGPAAVVLTVVALSVFALNDGGSALPVMAGVVAFFVVAIATWYGAGRIGGALVMRFGGSPFAALGLLLPSLLFLGYVAVSAAEGSRILLGSLVFIVNAMVLVVLGIRAAEQALLRRLRGPGPQG